MTIAHFTDWHQLPDSRWQHALARAAEHAIQRNRLDERAKGRTLGMVFFNPSLRTRASMELAAMELGARVIALTPGQGTWSFEWRDGAVMDGSFVEHVRDAFGVLSGYVDAIGVRVFAAQRFYEEDRDEAVFQALTRAASVPLINLESAFWHPCQALADALALKQVLGDDLSGRRFVLHWGYHPKALPMAVPNSAVTMAARLGMDVTVLRPEGFALDPGVMKMANELAQKSGGRVQESADRQVVDGAEVIYAKAWGGALSYLNPTAEAAAREAHKSWRIGAREMNRGSDPYLMHCLPVRRNVEVDDAALDAPRSLTQRQALNRLHAQKAILEQVWEL
jgi:N-acetylornithine carbamoyltransferase